MSCLKTLQIVCCVLAVVLVTAACSYAVEVVPIEGQMLVSAWGPAWDSDHSYYLEDSSDNIIFKTPIEGGGNYVVDPRENKIAYTHRIWNRYVDGVFSTACEVGKANIDGTNGIDITGPGTAADIGGINCWPKWSPDGSQIAFLHMNPIWPQIPCETSEIWVMNSDGTEAHQISPEGYSMTPWTWSPDGYRIVGSGWNITSGEGGAYLIDSDGSDFEKLPIHGSEFDFSADGSHLTWTTAKYTSRDGQFGALRKLYVGNIDGSNIQTLVESFVLESDIQSHLILYDHPIDELTLGWILNYIGPSCPSWSPYGNRIAFAAPGVWTTTIPTFEPTGPLFWFQSRIWVYDLGASNLTRISDHLGWSEGYPDWNGANTSSTHPEVTVNNTTVSFPTVQEGVDGLTTIIRDDDPPPMDTGYQFCGEYYEITTTLPEGSYTLPITITMTYKDEEVPGGNEGALELLHYNEVTGLWDNITTERNPVENWVKGETSSLSLFGLGLRTPVWLEPLKNDTSEASPAGPFKRGRTIPVKFRLMDTNGQPLADAEAQALHPVLQVFYERPCVEGTPSDPGETLPDVGAEFRYDAEGDLFIYNLSTKDPAWRKNYTYGLEVLIGGAKAGAVYFSLR